MRKFIAGVVVSGFFVGCVGPHAPAPISGAAPIAESAALVAHDPAPPLEAPDGPSDVSGRPWIGAAGASDAMLTGSRDTAMGVWVDVPAVAQRVRQPVDVALVIDTSGSMAGPEIDNARLAAKALIDKLADGDIVSIHTFSDAAQERVAPTELNSAARERILGVIAQLSANGGTNLFDGLRLAATRAVAAPSTHLVRRVVLISDGLATVGTSSPEILGALAQRSADLGVQITALGVGLDYDERTLDNLAVKSSGRLYHLTEPTEMQAILGSELKLLQSTMATQATVEIVPALGVQLLGVDGVRADVRPDGSIAVPLGTMFGGQHREMLLRVRVNARSEGSRPLASVRLRFKDPTEGNLERVQEIVARAVVTSDPQAVLAATNDKTQAIMAMQNAAAVSVAAAQQVNGGNFAAADDDLAVAETRLRESAAHVKDRGEQSRMMAAAADVSSARAVAKRAAAAPPSARPSAQRDGALQLNSVGMKAMGF